MPSLGASYTPLPGHSGSCGQRGHPPTPAHSVATHPLPHLCKHPPAARENGPFVPSLALAPRPSPSAAAPASATAGPGLTIVPARPWATLGPPQPGRWGRRLPFIAAAALAAVQAAPRGLSYGLCSWRVSDKQSCRNASRAPAGGLPASLHLRPSCFLSVSFVLGVPQHRCGRHPCPARPQAPRLAGQTQVVLPLGPGRARATDQASADVHAGATEDPDCAQEAPPTALAAESRGVQRGAAFADARGPVRPQEL